MSSFVLVILPYVTAVVFVGGLVYALRRLKRTAATGIKFIVYPAAGGGGRLAAEVARDVLLFPTIFATNKRFWLLAWLFHLTLLILFLGHFRVLTELRWFWGSLGVSAEQADLLGQWVGSVFGVTLLVTVVLLLLRRLAPNLMVLSVAEDYVLLLLILGLALTGDVMRFGGHINLEEFRHYFRGLATFHPVPPANPVFTAHFLLAQLMLMYFPFSKLMHVFTVFWTLRFKRS